VFVVMGERPFGAKRRDQIKNGGIEMDGKKADERS
jgi:hypothetical protein